ncbi:MAG TPA: hypothetical protein VJ801_07485 [Polyangia bacterium]|jgi:hypothetical protein|nr:hypothetical protein [Polyangia bacterium]
MARAIGSRKDEFAGRGFNGSLKVRNQLGRDGDAILVAALGGVRIVRMPDQQEAPLKVYVGLAEREDLAFP